jgi:deazaflavin-dependent oxidoreductase (nitroreductase family)
LGVLTTIGRKSGRPRPRCVRAIRRGDRAFLVAIGGKETIWVKNVQTNPEVTLRVRGGHYAGIAREPLDTAERQEAMDAFCNTFNLFDLAACSMHRTGAPSRSKARELHRLWFEVGFPLVIDLRTGS